MDGYRRKVAPISPDSLISSRGKACGWGSSIPIASPWGDSLTLIAAYWTMTTQQQEDKQVENQHRKISGYRELSQEEIDLMNRIKAKGAELLALQEELANRLSTDAESKRANAVISMHGSLDMHGRAYTEHNGGSDECHEFRRFQAAEPQRWAFIGKTDIQTGIMALVRAVAQPAGV